MLQRQTHHSYFTTFVREDQMSEGHQRGLLAHAAHTGTHLHVRVNPFTCWGRAFEPPPLYGWLSSRLGI